MTHWWQWMLLAIGWCWHWYGVLRDYLSTRRFLAVGIREKNRLTVWSMQRFGEKYGLIVKTVLIDVVLATGIYVGVAWQVGGYALVGAGAVLFYFGYRQWRVSIRNNAIAARRGG